MKKSIVHISDHALLRYIERIMLYDIEGLRRQLGREIDARLIEKLGNPCSVNSDGATFKLRGNTVTTCVPTGRRVKGRKRHE